MLSAIHDHWFIDAERIHSPNCDQRPNDRIDLLVIHCISLPPGHFGGAHVSQFFTNQLVTDEHPYFQEIADLKVSAHMLIQRDGAVIQFVPFNKRAWHAGKSCFRDEPDCNNFSIGIELEGTDEQPYEDIQYSRLAEVTRAIMESYPGIDAQRIVGHSDISPMRKTDPGPGFNWRRYKDLLE